MSFAGQQRPKCSWNYCSTCHRNRTRYPNGNECRVCYDGARRPPRLETKGAIHERERIARFLELAKHPELAVIVRERFYP